MLDALIRHLVGKGVGERKGWGAGGRGEGGEIAFPPADRGIHSIMKPTAGLAFLLYHHGFGVGFSKDLRITPLIFKASKQATNPFQHSGARRQAKY